MRIGFGYDIHRLVPDRPFILGGVVIPFELGFAAHSDGDVLIHAICDALFGAAAIGDIGRHFPDNDPAYKNINSRVLLQKTVAIITAAHWQISNIDSTIITEKPKLAPYIESIRNNLGADLNLEINQISVKAKTNEQVDGIGRKEAVAVHAVALLISS